jgi:hypothetical protein
MYSNTYFVISDQVRYLKIYNNLLLKKITALAPHALVIPYPSTGACHPAPGGAGGQGIHGHLRQLLVQP